MEQKLHKDRILRIPLPHFNYTVEVIFTEDIKGYAKKRGWKRFLDFIAGDDRYVRAYHTYSPEDCCSALLFGHDPSIKSISHECFHAVWRIMKHIGAEFENEVMAYHLGFLVEQITENLYKYGPTYEEVRRLNEKPKKVVKKKVDTKKK